MGPRYTVDSRVLEVGRRLVRRRADARWLGGRSEENRLSAEEVGGWVADRLRGGSTRLVIEGNPLDEDECEVVAETMARWGAPLRWVFYLSRVHQRRDGAYPRLAALADFLKRTGPPLRRPPRFFRQRLVRHDRESESEGGSEESTGESVVGYDDRGGLLDCAFGMARI